MEISNKSENFQNAKWGRPLPDLLYLHVQV